MGTLDGKVALITGAARGQGRSHSVGLAAQGADIIAIDVCAQIDTVAYPMATKDDLAETVRMVENLDGRILAVEGDVRDLAVLKDAVAQGQAQLGRLDIVLANAGIMPTVGEHGDDDQAFYDAIDVMLTGAWHTLRACTPAMIEQGLPPDRRYDAERIAGAARRTRGHHQRHPVAGVRRRPLRHRSHAAGGRRLHRQTLTDGQGVGG